MVTDIGCKNCAHKEVCMKRSMAIFMLYIQTGRYEEVEEAKQNLDVSADCYNWKAVQ